MDAENHPTPHDTTTNLQTMPADVLLPGDDISPSSLPILANKPLTIGPGLHHTRPSTITATHPGTLATNPRKKAAWIESNGRGRYIPQAGDLVLATIHHSTSDSFHCSLSPHTDPATLPHLAFEGATRKTRPQLSAGALVYARVAQASPHLDAAELECFYPSTGKADGLGELKGGMVFDVSVGMARRLMNGEGRGVFEMFGERGARFEVAVGRNGRVWVRGEGTAVVVGVGRVLREVDEGGWGEDEAERLVKRAMKG